MAYAWLNSLKKGYPSIDSRGMEGSPLLSNRLEGFKYYALSVDVSTHYQEADS